MSAMKAGRLKKVRDRFSSLGLPVPYSQAWKSNEYDLLCDAVKNRKTDVVKLLLKFDAKVNINNENSMTPLHYAVAIGDIEIVEMLLDRGAKINKHIDFKTPLLIAIKNKNEKIVELLLRRGASVEAEDEYKLSPLHYAAGGRNLPIVEHLLNHGANINSVYIFSYYGSAELYQYTPLCYAVQSKHEEAVKLLLSRGANVKTNVEIGKTVLHIAAEGGNIGIVEHLLNHGADINSPLREGCTPLHCAVEKQHEEIVKLLLNRGANVNAEGKTGKTALHIAVKEGYLHIVEELLKYDVDVNMLHTSSEKLYGMPLHLAIEYRHEAIAKLLISYGADTNSQDIHGKNPIFYAIKNADLELFKLLLTNGANVKDNPELLKIAVQKACREIVEELLRHGANINTSDEYGRTILHFAPVSIFGNEYLHREDGIVEIVKLLVNKGANVNAQTEEGITALHTASKKKDVQVVEALLACNADVNCTTFTFYTTPLHLSAEGYYNDSAIITKMLLDKGANINAEQKDGTTAFYIAIKEGSGKIVEVLLKYGAKVDSKFESNATPIHMAAQRGHEKVIEVLLNFGADIDSKDQYGRTPLHVAVQENNLNVVETLLKFGADIEAKDGSSRTALQVVSARKDIYMHEYRINEYFKHHLIKMKTAMLYVGDKNLSIYSDIEGNKNFQNKCEEEIASMKCEKFKNSNVSFYDILTKGINQLAMYAGNEYIVQVLRSDDYKRKFPIYAGMISSYFKKGEKRRELLEQSNTIFYFFFNNFGLPQECTEKIFSYLNNQDLRILKDTY